MLYFTRQSSSLIPMQATIELFDCCSLHILLYRFVCVCWGIVLEYHIGCTIPEVSAVHVCITPHIINVTLIVKSSNCLDGPMPYTVNFGTTSCTALLLLLYLHELLADNCIIYTYCMLYMFSPWLYRLQLLLKFCWMCMIHAGKDHLHIVSLVSFPDPTIQEIIDFVKLS